MWLSIARTNLQTFIAAAVVQQIAAETSASCGAGDESLFRVASGLGLCVFRGLICQACSAILCELPFVDCCLAVNTND
jgi:hypothetical protein